MTKKFEWNDELVLAFAKFTYVDSPTMQGRYSDLEQFKSSYTSKLSEGGWDIVQYWNAGGHHDPTCDCKKNGCKIFAVRRKDGVVFNLEDEYYDEKGHLTTISYFEENNAYASGMCVTLSDRSTIDFGMLDKAAPIPAKPVPLFTTEDGKEIYLDTLFWWVGRKTFIIGYSIAHKFTIYAKAYLESYITFSTEEAAKAFVLENKPVLSLKDIENCTTYQDLSGFKWGFINQDSITQLAKQRIGGKE